MATTTTKKRRRKRKGPETRGRKPVSETVRIMALHRHGEPLRTARIVFSEDVVDKLMDLAERLYESFWYFPRDHRMKIMRLQFARISDIGIPGIFCRVEPPTYDPRGHRVRRRYQRRQYYCQVLCRKLGLKDDFPTTDVELMWHDLEDQRLGNGLYLMLPDHYMLPPSPAADDPQYDLTV